MIPQNSLKQLQTKPAKSIISLKLWHYKKQDTSLVNKILAITKDGDYLTNPAKQDKVREYEREIDALVYKLYELTPEEIEIVEGRK